MAQDKYPFEQNNSPALNAFNITPHDTNELSSVTRAIFVGTGGDINLTLRDDTTPVIFRNVSSGTLLPLRVKLVKTASTTAQDIIGLY